LALRALTAAAAAGEPTAYYNLGILYSDGLAVAPDPVMACSCYRDAAERGHAAAAFNLGQAYRRGTGVAQDYAEAARWYRVAAEQGDYRAANELGLLYVEGKGVAQDLIEGFAWIYTGCHQSIQHEAAFKNAKQLAGMLTGEQIGIAQARGQDYYFKYIARQ
jgi:TPR repeat protein